jgi:hypothetical protein
MTDEVGVHFVKLRDVWIMIQSGARRAAKILFPRTDFELSQRKSLGSLGPAMNETPAHGLSMSSFSRGADLSNF